jgi:hypothetical protein
VAGEHAAVHHAQAQSSGQESGRSVAAPRGSLLYLQSAAGNQAVNTLLRRTDARSPATIQRTVWVKNFLTNQVEPFMPGLATYPVPVEVLFHILGPGDRYDEASGQVTRPSGEQVAIAALLSPGSSPAQPMTGEAQSSMLGPGALSGKRRDNPMSSSTIVRGMTEGRKKRGAQAVKAARTEARSELAAASREEATLEHLTTPMVEQINEATGQPEVAFMAGDEVHVVYVGQGSGGLRLMIASVPLPIADFILEMEARFLKLKAKAEDRTRVVKVLPRLTQSFTNFTTAKTKALTDLTAANNTFANVLSTNLAKSLAEQTLAKALHKLIETVKALANRFGKYVAEPGKAHKPKAADYYFKKMSSSVERYRVEGLVSRYEDQPGYEGSNFERDHQPHNDLIETMAALPEFAGRRMRTVAAGRTLKGWSIMLHHDRHAAGRTYSNKGGQVTAQFLLDLAAHRLTTPTPTQAQTRQFCIDYLVQSLRDDVAAMKAVANNDGNYTDLDAPVTDSVTKAAKGGPAPSLADIATAITNYRTQVKKQIIDGEDRMLATEGDVRNYQDDT